METGTSPIDKAILTALSTSSNISVPLVNLYAPKEETLVDCSYTLPPSDSFVADVGQKNIKLAADHLDKNHHF